MVLTAQTEGASTVAYGFGREAKVEDALSGIAGAMVTEGTAMLLF
jgi:hypothetical protein